jgi:PIN domain nuclease of toxin-antitoxin system
MLLDTQAFLWYVLDDPRLSNRARAAIGGGPPDMLVNPAQAAFDQTQSGNPEVLVSPASYWEIAIKISLGKYVLTVPFETFWRSGIEDNGFRVLPIEVSHAAALLTMPFHHRDPFDRLLVAQATVENIPLLSSDPALDAYPIQRLW